MADPKMIQAMTGPIRNKIESLGENRDLSELTPELAEEVTRAISEAIAQAGVDGYRMFLQLYGVREPDGEEISKEEAARNSRNPLTKSPSAF